MEEVDRVEVLCAAHLEGPGQARWWTCHLRVAAIARPGKLVVTATFANSSYYSPIQPWAYSSEALSEQEAVDLAKRIAADPACVFEQGRSTGDTAQREALRALFAGLKLKSLVDTTHGANDLAGNAITVGMGRYLATQAELTEDLTSDLSAGIDRYFAKAPFTFGYWAPYKRLIKVLEGKAQSEALLAVALARVDGQLHRVADASANEQLQPFVPSAPSVVASPDTIAYLMRRGRRWLRRIGRNNPAAYVRFAAAFLQAADAQGAHARISSRWLLADILYGRGASDTNHGHGALSLPDGQYRYSRRWDRFPKIWNGQMDVVRRVWLSTIHNPDIQAWAFVALKSRREEVPPLRKAGLRLALLSPSRKLQNHAFAQVAENPKYFSGLNAATTQVLLELGSLAHFSALYPTLEAHADAKYTQDAVLAYIDDHGFLEIRRGSMPAKTDKRSAILLRYSLRFLRSRLSAADTYHLARYVGQTTGFKPVAQWQETFKALPLKSLVELRLQLPDLPVTVVRSIDRACHDAVANGAGDENLAAALTLSPSRQLRALGWALLATANDATVATVWNNLMAQAASPTGLESLLEALRFKERVERIDRHASAVPLLSGLATATASAEPRIAESLLMRLAAKAASHTTLETMGRIVERMAADGWAWRPALLQKLVALDPTLTRLVWASVRGEQASPVAPIHVASRSLAGALVDAVEADEIKTIGAAQALYLTQALRSAPSRLYQEKGFAVSCATCPHPELQQLALARLESRRLIGTIFVSLAESGMPAAVTAAEGYVASIKEQAALTKAVIDICDSGSSTSRAIGLQLIERHPERLDLNALLAALAEHTSPDVTSTVARFATAGIAIRRDALDQFDNRILRTRRTGRKAKELVKSRLGMLAPEGAVSIGTNQKVDDRRVQALVDMARGSSLRDRDWALQQLARLALDGYVIPQVQVSTTS